eukprot:m.140343 g.140343  ORF g.140343 m.140343 type:complete len:677 (-) comp16668_c1_seq3:154-2184(-)
MASEKSKMKGMWGQEFQPGIKAETGRLIQVADALAGFHSKRAALLERFALEMQALVISTKRQLYRENNENHQSNAVTLECLWHTTISAAGRDAEMLSAMAEQCQSISEPLVKGVQLKKQLVQRIDADREQLEASLRKSEADVEKARQNVEAKRKDFVAAQKTSVKAKRKDSSAAAGSGSGEQADHASSALGYLRSVTGSLQAMRKDSAVEQEQTTLRRLFNAHNEYVLCLAGHNAELEKHADENMPIVLERLEALHVRLIDEAKKATVQLAQLSQETYSTMLSNQKALLQGIEKVSGSDNLDQWLASLSLPETAPPAKQLEFKVPADTEATDPWGRNELILEGCERALEKRSNDYQEEVMTLASHIGRVQNTLFGVERLHNEYLSNPAFGTAESTLPQLHDCQNDIREARTRMLRYHVLLALLQAKCAERPVSERFSTSEAEFEDDWAETDASADKANESLTAPTRYAIALYDYAAANADELSVVAGDILTVHGQTDAAWLPATLGFQSGVVPANYVQFFEGDPSKQVRALYEFAGSKDGELSFPAGAVITVTEPDQEGWTVGSYGGRSGAFPTSYADFAFARLALEDSGRPRTATLAPADVAAVVAANPHVPASPAAAEPEPAAATEAAAAKVRSGNATPTPEDSNNNAAGAGAAATGSTAETLKALAASGETDL